MVMPTRVTPLMVLLLVKAMLPDNNVNVLLFDVPVMAYSPAPLKVLVKMVCQTRAARLSVLASCKHGDPAALDARLLFETTKGADAVAKAKFARTAAPVVEMSTRTRSRRPTALFSKTIPLPVPEIEA
jgi:hypothetical protein